MAGTNTLGFDIVVQVNEDAVNEVLAPFAGPLGRLLRVTRHIPAGEPDPPMPWNLRPAPDPGFATVDPDGAAGDLSCVLRLAFTSVTLNLADGTHLSLGSASVSLAAAFSVASDATDFSARFGWDLDDPSNAAHWDATPAALTGTGITPDQARGWLLADVIAVLRMLPIPNPAPFATVPRDNGTFQLTDLELKQSHDATRGIGDRDVLALLLSANDGGGGPTDLGAPLPIFLPPGSGTPQVAFVLQNTFLQNQVCAAVITSLGGIPDPAAPCTLSSPLHVSRGGQQFDLIAIATTVDDTAGTLNLTLSIHSSGAGWHVQGDVTASLRFEVATTTDPHTHISTANLTAVLTGPPTNSVELFLEPWVWGLGIGIGIVVFVINPIIGIIVTAAILAVLIVITAVLSAVISGDVTTAVRDAVAGTSVVLPAAIADLIGPSTAVGVALDDLVIAARLAPSAPDPLFAAGTLVVPPGYWADLETLTVAPVSLRGSGPADLVWGSSLSALALRPVNGARFARVAAGWSKLSSGAVRALPLPGAAWLGAAVIPVGSADHMPPGAVVLAARTSSGRYAKLLAWRDASARLCLEVVVYDTPADEVHIAGAWQEVAPRTYTGDDYDTAELARYRDYTVAQRFPARAEPAGTTGPVSYTWMLNGETLGAGGTATSSAGTANYTVAGSLCTLNLPGGDGFTGTLTVTATDSSGLVATQSTLIDRPGVLREYDTTAVQNYLQAARHVYPSSLILNPVGPDPVDAAARSVLDVEQLRSAVAAGMGLTFTQAGLDINQVTFR